VFICLNACGLYNTCMNYVQSGVIDFFQERLSLGSQKRCATDWYQRQGFDTEPRWASGAVFGPRVRGKLGLEGQFRTLVCFEVSRSYLTSF
jgi:hypothetical protein